MPGLTIGRKIGEGAQCIVHKGILKPDHPLSAHILLPAIYIARNTYERMERAGKVSIYNVKNFKGSATKEANKLMKEDPQFLRERVHRICSGFLTSNKDGTYTVACKEFKQNTDEFRINREGRITGFANPNVIYTACILNKEPDKEGIITRHAVMEYIPTMSKKSLKTLTLEDCLEIGIEGGKGLAAIHACDFIHRDVKPMNFMMNRRKGMRVKIGDMGAIVPNIKSANMNTMTKSADNQIILTPFFASPEQLRKSETFDQRADIFGLGATLYWFITRGIPLNFPPTSANFNEKTVTISKRKTLIDDINIALNHNLMTNFGYQKPAALTNLLASYEAAPHKKFSLNPIHWFSPGRERKEYNRMLSDFELVIALMTNPDPKKRYAHVTDVVYDLQRLQQGRGPEKAYQLMKTFGGTPASFKAAIFDQTNDALKKNSYISKPLVRPTVKWFAVLGLLGALALGGFQCKDQIQNTFSKNIKPIYNKK